MSSTKAGKKHKVYLASPKTEGRATNIYKEHTSEGDFLWYTTEDGREVGRTRLEETSKETQMKKLVGYEFDIEFSKAAVADVQKLAFARTKYYHKDGHTRTTVKQEEF